MYMRRSKEEIIVLILEFCKTPASITRIFYQCALNFSTGKLYLDKLISAGLVEALDGPTITYKTTAKGLEALERMKDVMSMFGDARASEQG